MLVAGTTGEFPRRKAATGWPFARRPWPKPGLNTCSPAAAVSEEAAALAGLATDLTPVQQVPVLPSAR